MKPLLRITALVLCLLLALSARAEIVVVVNTNNPVNELSQRELVDIYMGRSLYFPDASLILRLDQAPESSIRKEFYLELVGKSVAEVNAYWARLLFTGRATPPQPIDNAAGILNAVQNNRNAIGYVYREDVNDRVKVVGSIK